MIDKLIKNLTNSEDTVMIINIVLAGIILLVVCLIVTVKIVQPIAGLYKLSKQLEKITKNEKPHWFYGHIGFFGKTPHERFLGFARLWSLHPTMMNIWRGPFMSSLRIHHPDLIQSLINSKAPKDEFGYNLLRPWLGDGLLTSKGAKWKRNRMLLTPAFHFSVLKPYTKVSNQTSLVLVDKWKKKTDQVVDITDDVSLMTLDTMVQCAMSTKTNCQLVEGQHPYIKAAQGAAKGISGRFLHPLYLIDFYYRWTKAGKLFYKNVKILHDHAEKIIADRRRVLQTLSDDQKKTAMTKRPLLDFLDILLQTKDEDGKGLTDQEIRDEVDTFMFEGHDTTSSGISWAIYNLAKYPEFQKKCREEIELICGDHEEVGWEDLNAMKYLTMFIKESLRLYPPVVAMGKKLDHPLTIKSDLNTPTENVIPSGTPVYISTISLHRSPYVWDNPEEFDPERFTKENCAKRSPHAYIPFSVGSRNCIGQNFAMNEMKVALSQLVRNFRIYLDEETPEPKIEIRLILQSQDGIHVKFQSIKD